MSRNPIQLRKLIFLVCVLVGMLSVVVPTMPGVLATQSEQYGWIREFEEAFFYLGNQSQKITREFDNLGGGGKIWVQIKNFANSTSPLNFTWVITRGRGGTIENFSVTIVIGDVFENSLVVPREEAHCGDTPCYLFYLTISLVDGNKSAWGYYQFRKLDRGEAVGAWDLNMPLLILAVIVFEKRDKIFQKWRKCKAHD